jgi:hypothetical protein
MLQTVGQCDGLSASSGSGMSAPRPLHFEGLCKFFCPIEGAVLQHMQALSCFAKCESNCCGNLCKTEHFCDKMRDKHWSKTDPKTDPILQGPVFQKLGSGLGSGAARHKGSSPFLGTSQCNSPRWGIVPPLGLEDSVSLGGYNKVPSMFHQANLFYLSMFR